MAKKKNSEKKDVSSIKNSKNKSKKKLQKNKVITKKSSKKQKPSKISIPKGLKNIVSDVKKSILPIKEKDNNKKALDDKLIHTAPEKETRKWPKKEVKKEIKESITEREERLNIKTSTVSSSNIPLPSQSSNIVTTGGIQSNNANIPLEEAVETMPATRNSGIVSEVTYDKIQNLTQKLIEGNLSQNDYRTLWNYHQFFKNEKGFLEEYASNLNPMQRQLLERTQYLMRTIPVQSTTAQYARSISTPILYQSNIQSRPQSIPVAMQYVGRNSIVDDFSNQRTQIRDIIERKDDKKEKRINDDYVPKT
jgi:hypothetical protein